LDPIVDVKDLVKVYEPDIRAVDGISFHVERGEIFGFLGPNGAGKSTTIKVLTTLIRRTSGSVRVDGIEVAHDPAAVRRIIGYAPQDVGVDDDLTGRENLRLQCRFYHLPTGTIDGRVGELLKTVDLEEAADRPARTYSGGMRKRLDLATALIHKPKLLFLDEPTTGLDPQNRRAVWEYIESLNAAGTTIFLTTQYMDEVDRLADRLSILDHGRIVAEGDPPKLKAEIGADVVEIVLRENGNRDVRERAKDVLARIPGVKEVRDYEDALAIYAHAGSSLVPQIVRALDGAGTEIVRLSLSGPSLDDVFLKHTGHKLRVEEVKPPSRTMFSGFGPRRRR
jgi:daunorubicin resistance ABC transporter ATP-binding subunit